MGVKGAALATVLSQACSAVWVLSFLCSRRASLPLERRYMKLEAEAISDATAAICCTLLFFWQFPKIPGRIKDRIV